MKFIIRGEKVKVTDSIKNYIESKIGKLDKYFGSPDDLTANVVIKVRGKDQLVEITIPTKNAILRVEESHDDLYAAIDLGLDKLERQIRKNKTKMQAKKVKNAFIDFDMSFPNDDEIESKDTIVKRKYLDTKPMSEEEAVLQMELLGHEFFIFRNDNTENVAVIYKRKDGNYGIIETK